MVRCCPEPILLRNGSTRWDTKGFQGIGNDNCFFGRPRVVDAVLSRDHHDQRAVYSQLSRLRLQHSRPEKQLLAAIKLEALPVVSSPGIVAAARATTFREARRALRCRFSTCHHDDLVMVVLPSVKGANDSCPGVTYLPRDQARTVIHESELGGVASF